jgi:hypothetical protein
MRWLGKVVDLKKYSIRLKGSMIPVLGPSQEMALAMLVWSCFRSPAV